MVRRLRGASEREHVGRVAYEPRFVVDLAQVRSKLVSILRGVRALPLCLSLHVLY